MVSEDGPVQADRLVTFLGTGRYEPTKYCLLGQKVETCYVTVALATILKPCEIVVLATDEAWEKHGGSLGQALAATNLPTPSRRKVGLGASQDELWDQFDQILKVLEGDRSIAIDITHSFRSQPFFASAVIQFFQSVRPNTVPLSVYYGAFEARTNNETPIWDMTIFVELLRWSRALSLFLQTGRADGIGEPTERLGRELRKQWAQGDRQKDAPTLHVLGKAIQKFGDDFVTLRTGSLISDSPSSAQSLLDAIHRAREEVAVHLRPLATIIDQLVDLVQPLSGNPRLSSLDGQWALQSLAKTYLRMGRYADAAAALREGWISRFADMHADRPGSGDFKDESREAAESAWLEHNRDLARTLADVRNDIEHAGFRRHPKPAMTIKRELEELIEKWNAQNETSIMSPIVPVPAKNSDPIFYSIGVDRPVTPEEPLPAVPEIPRGALVVVEGRGPIWRYGMALHRLHGSPAGAVAFYDPRLGAVVVASHNPKWTEGQVIDVAPPPSHPVQT